MPDIRYVCLSDMHLGASNSLLTNLKTANVDSDPLKPSPVLSQLVACLQALIAQNASAQKPTLILNGDIFELALTTDNEAIMAFERFVELIFPVGGEPLFNSIFYIPGNHDHHLWETARETQYAAHLSTLPPGSPLDPPWHVTNMIRYLPVPTTLMTQIIKRYPHLRDADVKVNTVYPNFALLSDDEQKCVVFSHGHFVESMYLLMSTLRTMLFPDRKPPMQIWDFEAENFAWIDFFWSTMGRSGEVGRDVELVYDKLQDERQTQQLLSNLATSLTKQWGPTWAEAVEGKALAWVFNAVVGQFTGLERHDPSRVLSADAEKGLWAYVQGPLRQQLLIECGGEIPPDVAFVFGHTHKPFEEDMNFEGYEQWVDVYNTGGWVVDTVDPEPLHGGAVILVDENLDTASLRMYNEAADPAQCPVRVEQATRAGVGDNPFHTRISGLVKPDAPPWTTFSELVARAVRVRQQDLRQKINSAT